VPPNAPETLKVVPVCDAVYARKTAGREGELGTEAQIISAEVWELGTRTAIAPENRLRVGVGPEAAGLCRGATRSSLSRATSAASG
jgi:hypothetical protein